MTYTVDNPPPTTIVYCSTAADANAAAVLANADPAVAGARHQAASTDTLAYYDNVLPDGTADGAACAKDPSKLHWLLEEVQA